jgi:hypothetical protein
MQKPKPITNFVGRIPYRLALAGGWIDQPFVSRHNPKPPGSMVVVNIHPEIQFMARAGLGTSTRKVAMRLWKDELPKGDPCQLARDLYEAENNGKKDPSGSQDMIGLVYPGISRLDYDFTANGGVFPTHVESLNSAPHARWLEKMLHILPVAPRPDNYTPLDQKNLDPKWIAWLGQTGKDCFKAIDQMNAIALGDSFNNCMDCWAFVLPATLRHPSVKTDLIKLLQTYQSQYSGAMYSGCGGGYLLVVSEKPVPGAFQVKVRTAQSQPDGLRRSVPGAFQDNIRAS